MTDDSWQPGAAHEDLSFICLGNDLTISGTPEEVREHFRYHAARKIEDGSGFRVTDASEDLRPWLIELQRTLEELGGHNFGLDDPA